MDRMMGLQLSLPHHQGKLSKLSESLIKLSDNPPFDTFFTDNPKDIEEMKKSMDFRYKKHCKTLSLLGSFVIPSIIFKNAC